MADSVVFGLENEVFSKFMFYSALLLLKTLAVVLWIVKHRSAKHTFLTPEDYRFVGKQPTTKLDPDIERVRRCHVNDLENIPLFVLLGFLYVLTNPDPWTATLLFRVFTGVRFLHTLFYLNSVPQPSRIITFASGMIVNVYMGICVLMSTSY